MQLQTFPVIKKLLIYKLKHCVLLKMLSIDYHLKSNCTFLVCVCVCVCTVQALISTRVQPVISCHPQALTEQLKSTQVMLAMLLICWVESGKGQTTFFSGNGLCVSATNQKIGHTVIVTPHTTYQFTTLCNTI